MQPPVYSFVGFFFLPPFLSFLSRFVFHVAGCLAFPVRTANRGSAPSPPTPLPLGGGGGGAGGGEGAPPVYGHQAHRRGGHGPRAAAARPPAGGLNPQASDPDPSMPLHPSLGISPAWCC